MIPAKSNPTDEHPAIVGQFLLQPPTVIGVGELGENVARTAMDTDDWLLRASLVAGAQSPLPWLDFRPELNEILVQPDVPELLLVGTPQAVASDWPDVLERFRNCCEIELPFVTTLEWGRGDIDDLDSYERLRSRMRLSRTFRHSMLTNDEGTELLEAILRMGIHRQLLESVQRIRRPARTRIASVGAAFRSLPSPRFAVVTAVVVEHTLRSLLSVDEARERKTAAIDVSACLQRLQFPGTTADSESTTDPDAPYVHWLDESKKDILRQVRETCRSPLDVFAVHMELQKALEFTRSFGSNLERNDEPGRLESCVSWIKGVFSRRTQRHSGSDAPPNYRLRYLNRLIAFQKSLISRLNKLIRHQPVWPNHPDLFERGRHPCFFPCYETRDISRQLKRSAARIALSRKSLLRHFWQTFLMDLFSGRNEPDISALVALTCSKQDLKLGSDLVDNLLKQTLPSVSSGEFEALLKWASRPLTIRTEGAPLNGAWYVTRDPEGFPTGSVCLRLPSEQSDQ